ncbi:MAG: ABC transporter permease [Candidatus Binatia bacterium]
MSTTRASVRRLRALAAALACAAALAMAAGAFSPAAGTRVELAEGLAGPSASHPLGQDKLGRDVLARVLAGARVSLTVALAAVTVSVTIGTGVGALAGFAGGMTDLALMRVVDVLLAFPGLLLAIAMAGALGPGTVNVIVALSVIGWTGYARLVRGEVRRIRAREHVEAAVALGVPTRLVLTRHILPLVAAPVAVQATFGAAAAVVAEASLSFLGVGVQPPSPSWGSMLAEARSFVVEAPHLVIAPGIAITSFVLALHLLGDAMRDVLDVKTQ